MTKHCKRTLHVFIRLLGTSVLDVDSIVFHCQGLGFTVTREIVKKILKRD